MYENEEEIQSSISVAFTATYNRFQSNGLPPSDIAILITLPFDRPDSFEIRGKLSN